MSGDPSLSVGDLVEYCRTQAGLLSGRAQTIGTEAEELLDEIDADIDAARAELEAHAEEGPARTERPRGPGAGADDVSGLEGLENDLERKQAIVEAKQARMAAFQDLAAEYADLAAALDAGDDGPEAALKRVVDFEGDHDAPAYFTERLTLYEAAAEASDPAAE